MDRRRFLLRRGLFALVAMYAVLTLAYVFVELAPDPNLALALWNAAAHAGGQSAEQARQAYLQSHGGAVNPLVKYGNWLWGMVTLQWGRSYTFDDPVLSLIVTHGRVTLLYLVPAITVSVLAGGAYGVYSATHRGSVPDRIGEVATYLGFGLPNVFLAAALPPLLVGWGVVPKGLLPPLFMKHYQSLSLGLLAKMTFPVVVLSTTLVAGIAHYTRSETADRFGEPYVKLVRAKGASGTRIARHVLRNAALPLIALTFSEFLAVVALHVFVVEAVFGIPGFGSMLFEAIRNRDVPLVMGATFVVVFAGILGNFLQDVLAAALDPRLQD